MLVDFLNEIKDAEETSEKTVNQANTEILDIEKDTILQIDKIKKDFQTRTQEQIEKLPKATDKKEKKLEIKIDGDKISTTADFIIKTLITESQSL